jgi:hypothetical protein
MLLAARISQANPKPDREQIRAYLGQLLPLHRYQAIVDAIEDVPTE